MCCPEAGGSTRPVFFPTPTPPKVNGEDLLPKGTKCGQTINERVVHGDNAPLYAYAWMALLGYQGEEEGKVEEVEEGGGGIGGVWEACGDG